MPPRILVVEDDPTLLQNITEYLQHAGYQVEGADRGAKALPLLKESWDLVITDLMLPDSDGIELLREIKRLQPGAEVVVLTGFGSIESAVAAMKSGAADYVTKPFRLAQLRDIVERVLARGQIERAPAVTATAARIQEADVRAEPVGPRQLWRRGEIRTPTAVKEEFGWLPGSSLIVIAGLADAEVWRFAAQLLSIWLQDGEGLIYGVVEEPVDRAQQRLAEFFPPAALTEGVATLVDLSSLWVRVHAEGGRLRVPSLDDVSRILLTALNRHRSSFDRVVLGIDSLSGLSRLLEEREAFQLLHLLRGVAREANARVLALAYREGMTTALRLAVEGLGDVVICLERDPIREVVRYEVEKGHSGERPRVGELRREGPFLVPVRPVSRRYGYARCAKCGEEFFLAFFTPAAGEAPFVCERCSR